MATNQAFLLVNPYFYRYNKAQEKIKLELI